MRVKAWLRELACKWLNLVEYESLEEETNEVGRLTKEVSDWQTEAEALREQLASAQSDTYELSSRLAEIEYQLECAPRGWEDLWDYRVDTESEDPKNRKTFWPRITRTDVWRDDLTPFFKRALLTTMIALANETDEAKIVQYQERAKLLNEWLETPVRAEMMVDLAMNNARGSGRPEVLDRAMASHAERMNR